MLIGWEGRRVLVVAFVEPGVSLRPFGGSCRSATTAAAHLAGDGRPRPRPRPSASRSPPRTFHDAYWVPGYEDLGLQLEQGATRVDVFLEDELRGGPA